MTFEIFPENRHWHFMPILTEWNVKAYFQWKILICFLLIEQCLEICRYLLNMVGEGGAGVCVVGCAMVLCSSHQQGVQLILAYSWARPVSLKQVRVWGEYFYFFYFFTFTPIPLSSLSLSFISSTISSISFLPFSGRRHKMTHRGWRVVKPQHNKKKISLYWKFLFWF